MTTLESSLLGGLLGLVGIGLGKLWGNGNKVTRDECAKQHAADKEIWQKDISYIKESILRIEAHLEEAGRK